MQDPGLQRVGQVDRVARALDVEALVALLVGGHVVDRGEVEEVVDLAAVLGDPGVADAEVGLGQVADHGVDAIGVGP